MSNKSIVRLCGILFLVTIAAWIVSNIFLKGPLQDAENYANTFQLVKDHAFQYRAGNFIGFLGVMAQFALAITLFQILKPVNPFFALLALGWRIAEQILLLIAILAGFLILGLSQTVTLPSGDGIATLESLGHMLVAVSSHGTAMAFAFLGIASILNNLLFYKSQAIPSSLAIFGVIGAVLYTLSPTLPMIIDLPAEFALIEFPLLLFELILGFYLIFWGLKKEIA